MCPVTPNPFENETTFSYEGTGVAETFIISVYNVTGDLIWSAEEERVTEVTWNAEGVRRAPTSMRLT